MCLSDEEKLILLISGSNFPLPYEKKEEILDIIAHDEEWEELHSWGEMSQNMLAITEETKNQSETFCL